MASIAFLNAIIFGAHGSAIKHLQLEDGSTSYLVHFLAGAAAGSAQAFLASPMEMLKLRVQIQPQQTFCKSLPSTSQIHQTQSVSPYQCFRQIVQEKSIRYLNRLFFVL